MSLRKATVLAVVLGFPVLASANLLLNPGFADNNGAGGTTASNWVGSGKQGVQSWGSHDMDGWLQGFHGWGGGTSGQLYQDVAGTPNLTYTLDFWQEGDDAYAGTSFGVWLIWLDASTNQLGSVSMDLQSWATSNDGWTNHILQGTSPVDTATVRVLFDATTPGDVGGAAKVDDLDLTTATGSSQLIVGGGALSVYGALAADHLVLDAGALLTGEGTIQGSCALAGIIAPGAGGSMDIGTLTFASSIVFLDGSSFQCNAASHTILDRIVAVETVTGTSRIRLSKALGAIPLNQIIIDGGSGSDYARFSVAGSSPGNWALSSQGVGDLLITDMVGDSDVDQLPDWWEAHYFGGRTNAVATADPDGDEMDNLDERIAGTNPTNMLSLLKIISVSSSVPDEVVISWMSVSNRAYVLECTTNLLSGFNTVIESNVVGTPPVNTNSHTLNGTKCYYYRVGVWEQQ